jgi:hypothetical protein
VISFRRYQVETDDNSMKCSDPCLNYFECEFNANIEAIDADISVGPALVDDIPGGGSSAPYLRQQ